MAKFKLSKMTMFLLILGVLALASLGFTIKEGLESMGDSKKPNTAEALGNKYDPFHNNAAEHNSLNGIISQKISNDTVSAQLSNARSALPKGIPRSAIAPGDEDLYILKSEVVPPVCPKCPDSKSCPREKSCPACPPCARCPEPAFECKKVPTYAASDVSSGRLPRPYLNDFSQF